ncbi:MAG TPA: hypothetical protein P5102_05095 [Candidatus Competibacteraceae bacterium]|nr:hypothetical protein [Candidatus Competibacteraceae bacterium]
MKITTPLRIIRDRLQGNGFRATYWDMAKLATEVHTLLTHPDSALRTHFKHDLKRFLTGGTTPVHGDLPRRTRAAVDWLLRAQAATPDDGVSLGYFPCDTHSQGWRPSYPETTGYIMTSLLEFARRHNDTSIRDAALRMGYWEISVQMPSGAVQGGPVASPEKQTPAAFNTGMVLDGWCSAYTESGDPAFLEAGRRAADFLANDLDDTGYFKTNGAFVSHGEIKTYTCLCAWAMYRLGILAQESKYQQAAIRSIEVAIQQQQDNGWFAHNCLSHSKSPLTHTMGYTLQGILEVGLLSERDDFVAAARRGIEPLVARITDSGFLHGRFYADWEPAAFSSCLTGSAQIAIVCYRLAETMELSNFADAADKLVDYLKALQRLDSTNPALNGALAGSFPFIGGYMRSGYPNWATKYLLDALMFQEAHLGPTNRRT